MIILETERLILRTLEMEDIDLVMSFWGDEEVMRFYGGAGSKEWELRSLRYYINMYYEISFSP